MTKPRFTYSALSTGVAVILGASLSSPNFAQDVSSTEIDSKKDTQEIENIIVIGQIGYRNRTDKALQTLEYDQEYFQKFEPLTAGDALKRMPSVTFLSDVIESDGARLRGLDPGYTQITINGDKVPGSNADRSFFLDRIPAELIQRVEIVRSSSAVRSGDAMAGTLNIVLKDAYKLDGGYIKLGALNFEDGKIKESLGLVWGGQLGNGRLLLGANIQGRYNPKLKESLRYEDSPENNTNFATEEFDDTEIQTDIRDGTDTSLNVSYINNIGNNTEIEISGVYVNTDRDQFERSFEYDDLSLNATPVNLGGNLLTDNKNDLAIEQDSYSLQVNIEQSWESGESEIKIGFSSFDNNEYETEDEIDFDDLEYDSELVTTEITDEEFFVQLSHDFDIADGSELEIGVFYQTKDRSTLILEGENELEDLVITDWNTSSNNPVEFASAFDEFKTPDGGDNQIDETRIDLYAALDGETDNMKWEVGLRYETTDVEIIDATADNNSLIENDYEILLPSAHFAYDLDDAARITGSLARTNRRPRFDYISPALLEGELGDNDLQGNPELDLETAWGIDLGYERKIADTGVFGVNVFYRDVSDLIEIENTGLEGDDGSGTFILTPKNTGDGDVWGIEFDLSAPLDTLNMPNTGVFANLSFLDSKITDFAGERKFNGQSDYVYNFGFIQEFTEWGINFGATYRKQGDAEDRLVGEEITTSYGADLEIFIEKSFGENVNLRAVGSNLLDASKNEVFNKFDTFEDQESRNFDEYELETETAGPVFQLIARIAF